MSKHNFGEMETTVGGWLAFFNGRKEEFRTKECFAMRKPGPRKVF